MQALAFPAGSMTNPNIKDAARIVVYVKSSLNFPTFSLYISEEEVIDSLSKNTYYEITLPPGKISLKTKGKVGRKSTEDKKYSLTLVAGHTYYLEGLKEYQYLMTSMHLVRRPSETAKRDIEKMKREFISMINP